MTGIPSRTRSRRARWRVAGLLVVWSCSVGACAAGRVGEAGRSSPLGAVQALFDALEARDPDALLALMDDGATVTALRRTPDGWRRSTRPAVQFAEGIASAAVSLNEVMRDPLVRVDGPLAVVWTPYDFFINGRPSHSGTDAVVLILDRGAWKV